MTKLEFFFQHYDTLASTNDEAIALAESGEEEGTVVTADFQLNGRGREGRLWRSARGKDLLLSLILRPSFKANHVSGLTLLTAEAVQETLAIYGVPSQIKRPNDVLVGGKKISGILTESQSRGETIDWCVIGVGLNVNSQNGDIPPEATSLSFVLGKLLSLEEVKSAFLEHFREKYAEYA
jgi:BirA family biotin operon repressor/biotin-[acetyl-CoA-carboxylase] ligase